MTNIYTFSNAEQLLTKTEKNISELDNFYSIVLYLKSKEGTNSIKVHIIKYNKLYIKIILFLYKANLQKRVTE